MTVRKISVAILRDDARRWRVRERHYWPQSGKRLKRLHAAFDRIDELIDEVERLRKFQTSTFEMLEKLAKQETEH